MRYRLYTVHERGAPVGADPDVVLVREGFAWGAAIFGSDVELPGRELLISVATSFATSFSATVRISSNQVSSFARLILLRTASLMEIFVSSGKFSNTCRTMISQLCSKRAAPTGSYL